MVSIDLQQWEHFAEFCRLQRLIGEPDSHMATAGEMVKDKDLDDRLWMAGCYVGVYNVPGAWLLFQQAPEYGTLEWIRANWSSIPFRRERRAVRSPEKLFAYLQSYAKWLAKGNRTFWAIENPQAAYDALWDELDHKVYGIGRYALLKMLEFMHRYCDFRGENTGIRARGGWSPQEGLALLFPDAEMNDALAEDLAAYVKIRLEDEGIALDWYNLQVLLCDYKQVWKGRRQYPGRSLDSELEYATKVEPVQPLGTFWAARRRLFPAVALGEVGGWGGVRKELGHHLRNHGHNWDPFA